MKCTVFKVTMAVAMVAAAAVVSLDGCQGQPESAGQGKNIRAASTSGPTSAPEMVAQPASAPVEDIGAEGVDSIPASRRPGVPTSSPDLATRPLRVPASSPAASTAPDGGQGQPARPAVRREKIAEADALMMQAMDGFRKLPSGDRSDDKAARAVLALLLKLIHDYPQCDQVDHAYFYAAELLKEYLDDPKSAVDYYQRAYQADPATPHPARFDRAMLLDFRLHRTADAIEEYRAVIRFEAGLNTPWAASNADFAAVRIRKLTGHE